nr:MAG TPA: hypothetical protein [Caudoviricetes sp.]
MLLYASSNHYYFMDYILIHDSFSCIGFCILLRIILCI